MRFHRRFDDLQLTKWSNHYVRYQLLRTLIRTASTDVAIAAQHKDQERVAGFHSKLLNLLNLQVESLVKEFDIPVAFKTKASPASRLASVEHDNALQALVELREDIKELHWFEYVNEQAYRLLHQKLERKGLDQHLKAVLPEVRSIFATRNDRIQLLEWVELAIMFVGASTPKTSVQLVEGLLSMQHLAPFTQDSITHKSYLHHLIRNFGRRAAKETHASALSSKSSTMVLAEASIDSDMELSKMISRSDLFGDLKFEELDDFKRLPLHYAVYYGLVNTTETVMNRLRSARTSFSTSNDPLLSPDCLDHSPLHIALLRGHMNILELLLVQWGAKNDLTGTSVPHSDLPVLAMKMRSNKAAALFIDRGFGFDYRDGEGSSIVHHAARFGQDQCLKILRQKCCASELNEADQNGLSPLAYASIHGHRSAVQLLLEGGADPQRQDLRGWTAKEYAAHKGHIEIAYLLNEFSVPTQISNKATISIPMVKDTHQPSAVDASTAHYGTKASSAHSTSENYSIIINMGSLDSRKTHVDLQLVATSTRLGLAIEVSARGDLRRPFREVIHLPILESTVNSPCVVSTSNLSSLQLTFRLLNVENLYDPKQEPMVLGTAVVLARNLRQGLGQNRESLMREATVPIVDDRQQLLATLTFWFLIVSPFAPSKTMSKPQHLHRINGKSSLIGHRGYGQNALRQNRPRVQVGENTLQSFTSAHDLGVPMVEFDVQMTADLVPLVYHDYLVSETGTDVPVHIVTLDQFRHISRSQRSRGALASMAEKRFASKDRAEKRQRARAFSMDVYDDGRTADIAERVQETYQFKLEGYKGNTRGDYVQEPINTLEELLKKLPRTLGFDIELKYPMLFEADDWHMPVYSIEINTYIDKILELCFALGSDREIAFSSFNPEICIALKLKQQTYPVIFVSDGGLFPTGDLRASNFQEAVQFSKRWNLAGVAMMADPFVLSRKLVDHVKQAGMFAISHGSLNNKCEHVKTQAEFGVDSLIVDDIVRITKTLEQHYQKLD